MFPEVSTFLKLDQLNLEKMNVCIIEEKDQLGSFLVHHFLSTALKNGHRVLFVGLEQSMGHYHAVALKTGVNLIKAMERKQLAFYEGLKVLTSEEGTSKTLEDVLNDLKKEIEMFSTGSESQSSTYIIVDKLTLLLSYGFPMASIVTFTKRLMLMTSSRSMTCVMRCRSSEEDDELRCLAAYVKNNAHLVTKVSPLVSGSSKDVSGHIELAFNPQGICDQAQYRVEERSVRVFAKGTSQAVL